jgi:hypothetical protein
VLLTATLNQEVQMDMDSVEVLDFDIKVKATGVVRGFGNVRLRRTEFQLGGI